MKELQKLMTLLPESSSKYYIPKIAEWSDEDKEKLVVLCNRLINAGCKNPIPWAYSEVSENIPQFGRFLVLKNLINTVKDIDGLVIEASTFDEDFEKKYNLIKEVLGDDFARKMLCAYGRSIISGVISMIDEGNYSGKHDNLSWYLSETDGNGTATGRTIQGLHEDFLDFDECEL